jgi:hypothetical protein
MENLGWVQHRCRENGARIRVWERKLEPLVPTDPTCPNLDRQLSENFLRSDSPGKKKWKSYQIRLGQVGTV